MPTTKDDTDPCRGCILPACKLSTARLEAVTGMSSAKTMSSGGRGGGDAHESERSLLSFSGSELSRHLHHIDSERVEAIEGLL